jgi:hypothetical protein
MRSGKPRRLLGRLAEVPLALAGGACTPADDAIASPDTGSALGACGGFR